MLWYKEKVEVKSKHCIISNSSNIIFYYNSIICSFAGVSVLTSISIMLSSFKVVQERGITTMSETVLILPYLKEFQNESQ